MDDLISMISAVYSYAITVDKDTAIVIVMTAIVMTTLALVMYVTRIKDHMREEKRIDDSHFAKVKEHLGDLIESVEEAILQRGLGLIEKYVPEPTEGCSVSRGIDCQFMQKERFENDMSKAIEGRLKNKSIGWMKENGFHESDKNGLENYIEMRKKNVVDFLIPYIEKKARVRFKSLSGKVKMFIDENEIAVYLTSITKFAIEEQKLADKEIAEYRRTHGFLPELVLKLINILKRIKK